MWHPAEAPAMSHTHAKTHTNTQMQCKVAAIFDYNCICLTVLPPDGINARRPTNSDKTQNFRPSHVAAYLLSFYAAILISTLWHLLCSLGFCTCCSVPRVGFLISPSTITPAKTGGKGSPARTRRHVFVCNYTDSFFPAFFFGRFLNVFFRSFNGLPAKNNWESLLADGTC